MIRCAAHGDHSSLDGPARCGRAVFHYSWPAPPAALATTGFAIHLVIDWRTRPAPYCTSSKEPEAGDIAGFGQGRVAPVRHGLASVAQFQPRAGCSPRSTLLLCVCPDTTQFAPTLWSLASSMALPPHRKGYQCSFMKSC